MTQNDASSKNWIDQLGDDYYRARVFTRETKPHFWFARLVFSRLDSGEDVGGYQTHGATPGEALTKLQSDSITRFQMLERPPHEWQKVRVRNLIANYREFNDSLTAVLVRLQKRLAEKTLTSADLHEGFWEARDTAIIGATGIAHQLNNLTEDEVIGLMSSSDEAYTRQDDPAHLDDMDARSAIFDFLIGPSQAVLAAHAEHDKRRSGGDATSPPTAQSSELTQDKFCCETMRHWATFQCPEHPDPTTCPDCIIAYNPESRRFGIRVHDGGSSFITIQHCPWCGTKLARSGRGK